MNKQLTEREAAVMECRRQGMTYSQIAQKYQISSSRVGAIYHKALRKTERVRQLKDAEARDPRLIPIELMGFSVHVRNAFERKGWKVAGHVADQTERSLLSMRNFGSSCLEETIETLSDLGLRLRHEGEKVPDRLLDEDEE